MALFTSKLGCQGPVEIRPTLQSLNDKRLTLRGHNDRPREAQQHVLLILGKNKRARSKERRGEGEERERQRRATRSPAVSAVARSRVHTVGDAIFTGATSSCF